MSKFIKLTMRSTGLPLAVNADRIETMIPLDGYTSIRTTGMPFGEADHVLESIEQIEAQLLRDELAMRAMAAMITSGATYQKWEHLSIDAYALADAMLKERLK